MNKITTTSTCGRCGATEIEEGAHGEWAPNGWSNCKLLRRSGEAWNYLFRDDLCPPCQDVVLAVLNECHSEDCDQVEAPDAD